MSVLGKIPKVARKFLEVENDFSDSPVHKQKGNIAVSLIGSEAARQGLQVKYYGKLVFDVSGNGRRVAFLQNSPENSAVHSYCAKRKDLAKRILCRRDIPVPVGAEFSDREKALEYFYSCNWPVVLKPTDRSHGTGVTTGVATEEQFLRAWDFAAEFDEKVLVEQSLYGYDLRVIVIGGKAVSAYVRMPANVIGDGESTILELVEKKNQRRLRNPSAKLSPVRRFDFIEHSKRNMADVPVLGELVQLASVANVSAGGDAVQVIDHIDVNVLEVAIRAASCFPGLHQVGVDLIIDERGPEVISHVIEVNANPTISSSVFPTYGRPVNIPGLLLGFIFRNEYSGRRQSGSRFQVARPYGLTADLKKFGKGLYQQQELIGQAAYAAGLGVQSIDELVFEVVGSQYSRMFYKGIPDRTSAVSLKISRDRRWVAAILEEQGLLGGTESCDSAILYQYRVLVIDGSVVACLCGGRYHGNENERCSYDDMRLDVTDLVHAGFAEVVCRAVASIFNPYLAGVDLLAADISSPPETQRWRISDILCNPRLSLHHFPLQGVGRDVAGALVRALFPGTASAEAKPRCVHAIASGQLQGVGYCNWVRQQAVLHGVAGWVRNLGGSGVEMLLQGAPIAVASLLNLLHEGHGRARITDFLVSDHAATSQYGFCIYR